MKNLIAKTLILLLLTNFVLAQSQEDYFNNALDYYLDGKYEQALESLNKVTSPEFDVSSLKSQILDKLGKSGGEIQQNTPSTDTPQSVEQNNNAASSDDELYFEAVELFQKGEYEKAKEILLRINSDEIDVAPLLQQINELDKNSSAPTTVTQESSSEEEKYFKALELYQNGSYQEALKILNTISTQEIDTKPLIDQIQKIIKGREPKPQPGEEVDITPFEYKIRKKIKKETIEIEGESDKNEPERRVIPLKEDSISFFEYLIIAFIIIMLILLFYYLWSKKFSRVTGSEISLRNKTKGHELKFSKSIISIGRDDTCDFILDDEEVSRRHAEIVFDPSSKSFVINDLNSTNGVIVNGKKVGKIRLYSGDNIKIGNQLISVSI